ncbi:hypothetical protein C0992_012385, partial [Termitomyces sp. T32_za158]
GQRVPRAESTEYIELFARIFELELNEYIKRKAARGTATSTATPAESVDYDALLRQRAPDIAEAMDILNAPKQANESQQDYERRQNAARRQSNTSGMPRQALSEVETATSHPAGEDETNIPPEDRTLRRRVTIKEEERDESVPDKPATPRRVARRVHLVDNWNERVNYQRIRNQDLRVRGESLIDDQGIVFEGRGGVTPIDDMRRQFIARTGEPDRDPGNDSVTVDMVVVPTTGMEEIVETIGDLQVVNKSNQYLRVRKVRVLNAGLRSPHTKQLGHGLCPHLMICVQARLE